MSQGSASPLPIDPTSGGYPKRLDFRAIVEIDETKCNGCGLCIPTCVEGALQLVDGKVQLVSETYCDGLGACLSHCPRGALHVIQREAEAFDAAAVHAPVTSQLPSPPPEQSALRQWPVQLNLVPSKAAFFDDRELLVIANCVPLAYPQMHSHLLTTKAVVIGCPKFDDASGYVQTLTAILQENAVRRITVAHMEVPCCAGLRGIVHQAIVASGKPIPFDHHVITIRGEMA